MTEDGPKGTSLSIIVVRNPVLPLRHLELLVDALNRQSSQAFNTFWIDQNDDPGPLLALLRGQARFGWELLHAQDPVVEGVRCWELVRPFARVIAHPAMGRWFTYLHMECLPEADFVAKLNRSLAEIEQSLGPRFVAMLQQLWCDLSLAELHPRHYLEQCRHAPLRTWIKNIPYEEYRRYSFAWFEQPWEEDAFAMPTALARELQLFAAPQQPLWFQDIFDIFRLLPLRPYLADLCWVRVPEALIYHIDHPRAFNEYSAAFFAAVRAKPQLFGHCSLYELAHTGYSYQDTPELRRHGAYNPVLLKILEASRNGSRGTLGLWLSALDRVHGSPSLDWGPRWEAE